MCGICGMLIASDDTESLQRDFYLASRKIAHRGPDKTTLISTDDYVLCFHRLAIQDLSSKGDQPFKYENDLHTVYVICNGEIYNHKDLERSHEIKMNSSSDCEIILHLYLSLGIDGMDEICNSFNSEHVFAIVDITPNTTTLILSSDRFGIRPLFTASNEEGFYFSSELQGLPYTSNVQRFPPRNYGVITKKDGLLGKMQYTPYYSLSEIKKMKIAEPTVGIEYWLRHAVIDRLQSDRPIGALLSGGLDSSLVCAIAATYLKEQGRKLRTFSIGTPGGTDEKYALMVAKHIDSIHHHVSITEDELIKVQPRTIKCIGSFDITTVRASCCEFLIAEWISKNTDIKVIIGGDGADELMGSYKYFINAPSPNEFHDECVRLLDHIHEYDGLRADRCIAHFGMEARFPFLDFRLVEFVLQCDPALRMPKQGVEKWLLRQSFLGLGVLPEEVRTRSKEAMSDGVIRPEQSRQVMAQKDAEKRYTDEDLKNSAQLYTHLPPPTKEALLQRETFCDYFGNECATTIPFYWMPKFSGDIKDPSARVLSVYS